MINLNKKQEDIDGLGHALCCADWVEDFNKAAEKAHGGSWSAVKELTLEQAMRQLAPNGFRIIHRDTGHVSNFLHLAEKCYNALPFIKKVD